MITKGIWLSLLALCSVEAVAENHAIAAKAGFLGLGIEYTYTIDDRMAVRGGINGSEYGFDAVESGIAYDFDIVWDSISAAFDFHPTRGPFRLTAGLLSNDNGLDARSRLAGSVNVGGTIYTPAEVGTLRAAVGFDSTAPFVGVGWDWSRKTRKVGVSFDLGILSQGSPRVTLTADGSLLGDPAFAADLEAERLELEAAIDDFDLVPYATIGLVVKF